VSAVVDSYYIEVRSITLVCGRQPDGEPIWGESEYIVWRCGLHGVVDMLWVGGSEHAAIDAAIGHAAKDHLLIYDKVRQHHAPPVPAPRWTVH
jgi:hypothetical protein